MKKTDGEIHQPDWLKLLLLAIFVALIGSSTAAYGQEFFEDFESAPNLGDFTRFPSPNSVTFTGGFTQSQGQPSLYHSGVKSFMVNLGIGNTATITFETPAASVTLWLIDQSNTSVLTAFDQNNQVIATFNATTGFVLVNIVPGCGQSVGSITLQNNGSGMAVIDDFSFTAGQAQSGGSTVLIANFMNGNNTVNDSRVYLWNPSASAGEVCVRVFTLPVTAGTAQELTATARSLGSLGAGSALNVKLAEDILTPEGITVPYTTDDGDLTLEFAIQAAGVKGAAQVFSSSFASGTNPLQEVPSTPGASPTVLVANFMNGNNAFFDSRVYLWNPSTSAGDVTVRVFTLPLAGDIAQELTFEAFNLGSLEGESARNIKLAEDILDQLPGITTPYITDGGNLTLEFTIQAADVVGAAQVFSSSFAFGVYPLQQIPSTSAGSPTVLAANFMNGNNAFFDSRVYLWNPSISAGDVTVRVFTLPLAGDIAQELTVEPFSLGSLEGESARNIKLAEDILDQLPGITTPYITDGGNLTLEFTIQSADVVGAAQVFSPSFAFGTNPLQAIPSTSAGSPTVLVANFMNGNNAFFDSRVYLWNPSTSAGDVTVRVFTLPLADGLLAQELTVEPFILGSLEGESARNVKLAEDILDQLPGITTPYVTDGGNLTLEFTIQAADVVGAAQVFSSSFAFGTYIIQDPPGAGAGSTPNPNPGPDPGPGPDPDPYEDL